MIRAQQLGGRIDHDLKEFHDAENEDNNGKVIYIRDGKLAFETGENLFNITPLIPVED